MPTRLRRLLSAAPAWLRTPPAAGMAATLLLLALVLPLRWAGALQSLELAAYDALLAVRHAHAPADPYVVQITVTEADIERFGWPLSDGRLAAALERLSAAGPLAIGIDIFRPTPIGPGSDALDAALRHVPQVIWADRFGEGGWAGIAAPALVAAARRNAFSDVVADDGGVARRGLLYLDDGHAAEASIGLRLALLYLRAHGIRPAADGAGYLRLGQVSLPPLGGGESGGLGGYRLADTRGYQVLREYRTAPLLTSFTLAALLDGTVPPDAIAGRIVVLGIAADSVKDFMAAPTELGRLGILPGVTLHGLFAGELVAHGLAGLPVTHPLSRDAEAVLIATVILAGGLVAVLTSRLAWLAGLLLGGAALLVAVCVAAFAHSVWLPVAPLVGGWLLAGLISSAAMTQVQNTQRRSLMRLFSTHVSAPVAQEMWRNRRALLRDGRPRPVRLDATVLFSDVNDFTTATEDMDPEAIVRWLEPYMQAMTQLVDDFGGVVERFSGDGVLAMFGVPIPRATPAEITADAAAAVRCALQMRAALAGLNQGYRAAGLPEIRIAVGIQSGALVSCTLGSLNRQQYTTMGDTTNTAARLVTTAKATMKQPGATQPECCIVIGGPTRALIGSGFEVVALGPMDLKGKRHPTATFSVEGAA